MNKLIRRRILAFGLDYLLIVIYALFLLIITKVIGFEKELSPIEGQLLGFITLTLPVYFYFFWTEKSNSRATWGKRIMKISVYCDHIPESRGILLRNILKFLPWEIAHFGVHWVVHYSALDKVPPIWVWLALIIPQIIVFGYFLSLFLYKGKSSAYDMLANTGVKLNK